MKHPEWPELTVADVWQDEQVRLMPCPTPFNGYIEQPVLVSPTSLIHYQRNRYSVPCEWINSTVSLRAYPAHLLVVAADGECVTLKRSFERDKTIYDWTHYISLIERKPGALRNGAPFKAMPEPLLELQRQLLKNPGGDRVMAKVLNAVTLHGLEPVLVAVELALQAGRVSGEHVLNILSRLQEPTKEVHELPIAIDLVEPSQADVHRYPEGTGTEWLLVRDSWVWITFSLGYVVLTATASVLMDAYRSDKFRLEQLLQKVEGRLKDRESALMSMLVAHAERDKDPVVASLAHELRQPLHSIQLNAEYLSSGKTVSRQEEADILRSILDENRRAADLLQGLRNIFVNKVPESLAAINLSQWLTDWVQAKAPGLMNDHGIALQLHAQSDVHVHVHAAQVEVIVQNLVTNAVQALQGQPRGSIHLSLVAQQPWACLDVVDNGPGLPEGWSEKVYDMGVSTKADGMGMGLWLSRRIAETHGGTLSSQPSTSGAHMRLHLPLLGIGSK
jgi:signal transduction histidine kinase